MGTLRDGYITTYLIECNPRRIFVLRNLQHKPLSIGNFPISCIFRFLPVTVTATRWCHTPLFRAFEDVIFVFTQRDGMLISPWELSSTAAAQVSVRIFSCFQWSAYSFTREFKIYDAKRTPQILHIQGTKTKVLHALHVLFFEFLYISLPLSANLLHEMIISQFFTESVNLNFLSWLWRCTSKFSSWVILLAFKS